MRQRRALLLLLCAGLPLAGCHEAVRRTLGAEELSPEELRGSLGQSTIILDLRDPESYRAGHVPGALSMRIAELAGYLHRARPPFDRPVITVCARGLTSLGGAVTVESHGPWRARSLRGGMQAWAAQGYPIEKGPGRRLDPRLLRPPEVETGLFAGLAVVISGFVFKPIYMVLTLGILLWLRRATASDLRLLSRGMMAFLVGEGICLVNYLFYGESDQLDLVHGLGMVLMSALVPWALFRLLDERVLRLSDPEARCLVQRFCGRCFKQDGLACGVQRLFLFLAPSLALVALLPWAAPIRRVDLTMNVFGTAVPWFKGIEAQLIEFRLYPAIAAALLLLTTLQLLRGRHALLRAQAPFFSALGFLSYSLLRAALFSFCQRTPAWSSFWEELTELMMVLGVALLLWVFRVPLGLQLRKERG